MLIAFGHLPLVFGQDCKKCAYYSARDYRSCDFHCLKQDKLVPKHLLIGTACHCMTDPGTKRKGCAPARLIQIHSSSVNNLERCVEVFYF